MSPCPSSVVGFSPQFKAEAMQMVIETGKPIAVVARDLGVHDGTLGNWVNAWRREHPEPEQPVNPAPQPVQLTIRTCPKSLTQLT
jgi:transposase-like protein